MAIIGLGLAFRVPKYGRFWHACEIAPGWLNKDRRSIPLLPVERRRAVLAINMRNIRHGAFWAKREESGHNRRETLCYLQNSIFAAHTFESSDADLEASPRRIILREAIPDPQFRYTYRQERNARVLR